MPIPDTFQLIATSAVGLEAVVARELTALGYEPKIIDTGRIAFTGDGTAIVRTNLWLRAGDRVLVEVGRFRATDFGSLFDQTYALPWHEWISEDAYFPVNGRSVKSQLSSVPACQKIVKKAIAEKLLAAHHVNHLPDERDQGSQCIVEVAIRKDEVTLTLDTTGIGLHKRGYRAQVGAAPLKETLAAGMILLSYWRYDRPMIDPFCGSGTLVIEAAMIGRNLAPGLKRSFISETWPWLNASLWEAHRQQARDHALPNLPVRIIGTDIDEDALNLARRHAALAGVEEDIHFQQRDFLDLAAKHSHGCLITNPPYGQRLGDVEDVEALYQAMPHVLAKLKTWSHYILTAHPGFEQLIGQQADRRRKLYNAQIACTYYQFHGPPPGTPASERMLDAESTLASQDADARPRVVAQPAFGGLSAHAQQQAILFRNRLTKCARHLRKWPTHKGITCFRLYERDIPEVPLVVDRYEDCLHMAEYERPHDHTDAQHRQWLDLMQQTAADTLGVERERVFFKHRKRQRDLTQHERFSRENKTFIVQEDGLKFKVNLSDYVDTGLFLDHRLTRHMVRQRAKGCRFLNLFAYTGSFTVYAAAGGAIQTTTVDLSHTYLDWAQENLALNGLQTSEQHKLVRADSLTFLEEHPSESEGRYDLAVVDPPTFSNSKHHEDIWDVQRDHVRLLNLLATRMSSGGQIYFSTNFRRFKLDADALQGIATIHEISKQTVPDDFRNKRIHRCWHMAVK